VAEAVRVITPAARAQRVGVLPAPLFSQGHNQLPSGYRPLRFPLQLPLQLVPSNCTGEMYGRVPVSPYQDWRTVLRRGVALPRDWNTRPRYRRGSPPQPCPLPRPRLPPASAAVGGSGCALPTGRCSPRLFQSPVSSAATKPAPQGLVFVGRTGATPRRRTPTGYQRPADRPPHRPVAEGEPQRVKERER
jgi:hypothetical protein